LGEADRDELLPGGLLLVLVLRLRSPERRRAERRRKAM
jgi:hypothetical protein